MDNELDARGTLEVQRHLDTCAVCVRSLTGMIDQDRALREAARTEVVDTARLRQLIIEEVKRHPRPALPVVRRLSVWKRAGAIAAMLVVAIGIGVVMLILGNRVPKVYADAVSDHLDHCTLDVLKDDAWEPEVLKPAAKDYCGVAVLPDISQYGFTKPRARECTLDGEVFMHLVYFNGDQPLSVFVSTHSSKDIAASMKLRELSGYTIASINTNGVDVVILTTLDERRTRQVSETIAGQIRQAVQESQTHGWNQVGPGEWSKLRSGVCTATRIGQAGSLSYIGGHFRPSLI
jgi:hypothetical protein